MAELRRDRCRLNWVAGDYARMTGSTRQEVIDETDDLISRVGRTARPPAVPLDGRARGKKKEPLSGRKQKGVER